LRKPSRREKALLGVLGVAVLAVAAWALRHPEAAPSVLGRPRGEPSLPPVPRIDFARVEAPRGEDRAGRRNLFDFGSAAELEEGPPPIAATPPPLVAGPTGGATGLPGDAGAPAAPSLPPLNLKYMGSVESKAGVRVAVLITDRKEILTGQPGQVVANRYRIARIGLESVDLEDVNSGQSRRIPLRAN
jgi:hypothetical protein